MNIGAHTFEEFKEIARQFHGYPAPGLLIGGYMVEMAKARLPEGVLFEAVVETGKCLPDAVQLLTLCSVGNGWMRIINLGRYALCLYDKHTGNGLRGWIDSEKLKAFPEIEAWFMKTTPKKEQDTDKLFAEIEIAGDAICSVSPVSILDSRLGKSAMGPIEVCPVCAEAYPVRDGAICRGCQGEAPYKGWGCSRANDERSERPELHSVPLDEAVGKSALHDMTRIDPGKFKGAEFKAGQVIGVGDVCRLQQMGKQRVYVDENISDDQWVHENDAVQVFAKRMAGPGIGYDQEPHEGKIDFTATCDGLFVLEREKLKAFNLVPGVMCATRQGDIVVASGKKLAGSRAIPLYISRADFSRALAALNGDHLFEVRPLRKAQTGILVTGSEVFQGLIKDKFIPIISAKVEALGSEVTATQIVPDEREAIAASVKDMLEQGCDLIVTTAGLSVDPDDVTRAGLKDAGLVDDLYGAPVLPGAMTLVGRMGDADVIGVPACALFFKTTSLDLILPRLLAGQTITRSDLVRMAEGGFCLNCKVCTFPKCPFGK